MNKLIPNTTYELYVEPFAKGSRPDENYRLHGEFTTRMLNFIDLSQYILCNASSLCYKTKIMGLNKRSDLG